MNNKRSLVVRLGGLTSPVRLAWLLILLSLAATTLAAEKPVLVLDAGGHTAKVWRVLFSRDGKELISVSDDKTIRIWDVQTGDPLRVLRPPIGNDNEGRLYAAALAPDGNTLAVSGYTLADDGSATIHILSLKTGQIERMLSGHENVIYSLAFDAEGRRLISGSGDKTARIWNVRTGQVEQVLKGHSLDIYGVTFSPDGRRCATASLDTTAAVWDVATGQRQATLSGHTAELYCVAWRRDGAVIATGSVDHTIRQWSPEGKVYQGFYNLGECQITSVAFTADGQRLLYTSAIDNSLNQVAAVLDVATGREVARFNQHANTIMHGALSPDGTRAATGDFQGEIFLWSSTGGRRLQKLASPGRVPWAAAWNPNGTGIAWGNTNDGDTDVNRMAPIERTFDLATLEFGSAPDNRFTRARPQRGGLSLEPGQPNQSGVVSSVLVRPSGRTLEMDDPNELVRSFTLLPGDRAAVGTDHRLLLYDARAGTLLRECQGHMGTTWAVSPSSDGRYLLSAGSDMTLRVWDPAALGPARKPREVLSKDWIEFIEGSDDLKRFLDQPNGLQLLKPEIAKIEDGKYTASFDLPNEPLLSCFFAGNDWIVWTSEGYYAASPGGEKLMGWHVNNGYNQMASFYPASQFRSTLYRPDVIKLVLKTGSVARALEIADTARGRMTEKTDVAAVLPPQVRITSPNAGYKASQTTLDVRAVATSAGRHPVTALRLLLDGRPYQGLKGVQTITNPQLGEVTKVWQIELEPGKHKLKVLADSAVSQGTSEEVEVVYVGGSELADQVRLPKLYVVAIGISEYPGDLKLNYAAKDAQTFVDSLKRHSRTLFREIEVQVVKDKDATRGNILKGLGWLRSSMTQNDYGIFFYAGHRDLDNDGSVYFLPVEADPKDLLSTAIPDDQFKRALTGIPGKLMTVLDACHAGAVAGSTTGKRRSGSSSLTDDLVRDLVTDENGVVAMCSSTGREFSLENNEFRQGTFTLAIVEGLSGKADFNKDGVVYLNELDAYVTDRVKELTRGQQHPVTGKPGSIRSFPLAKP